MLAFTLRRVLQAIGVMLAVGVIAFAMFRFARPGEPDGVDRHLGRGARLDPAIARP